MKVLRSLSYLTLTLALAGPGFPPLAAAPAATSAAEPDWRALVGDYPQPGSLEGRMEVGILVWLQRTRTSGDVARASGEGHPSLGCFVDILKVPRGQAAAGILADRPLTAALLDQARRDLAPIVNGLKAEFDRPRPYASVPALVPALPMESSPSYPSSISALGTVYAHILSQFQPGNREAILERGGRLGADRAMAGLHWPSDVTAGQRLGHAFATHWINQPEHRQLIKDACAAEWSGRQAASALPN